MSGATTGSVASRVDGALHAAFDVPRARDAAPLWRLVEEVGTLERNTAYLYLLLCTHFAESCVLARSPSGELEGFLLGYRVPDRPGTYFVWQVGVHPRARGRGLATQMLDHVAARLRVSHVEATVGEGNDASDRLFRAFARAHAADLKVGAGFPAHLFPTPHEAERLYRIGPLRAEGDLR